MNDADYARGMKEAATPPGGVTLVAMFYIFCICFTASIGEVGAKYLIFYNAPNALEIMSMLEIMWIPWLVFGGSGLLLSMFLFANASHWAILFTAGFCYLSYIL